MKEKRKMLDNFYKKPYGNLANLTPAERRSLEIVQASRQSRSHTPKFPPMAGVGYNVYEQLKSTASVSIFTVV